MIRWLWHEQSNLMCIADCTDGGLPLLSICDDDVNMINPYYSYPLKWLIEYYGFIDLGEF
jgi:hypothetical protein